MPSLSHALIPHYEPAPPTKEPLDYAELPIVDLSKASTYEGRLELAVQVRQAMSEHGFFYAVNHGYSKEQMDRVFDIADVLFTQVSDEEKDKYVANSKATGSWQGYKPRQFWIINAGDGMELLSGGLYRATIHRVIQPPKDQRSYTRLGIFYFSLANDDVKLAPLAESPVLQRVGIKRRFPDSEAPTSKEWRKARTAAYGQSDLKESRTEKGVEEELILSGVVVKHYK
ncbi:hypothetical protein D9757_001267 [Collybiopsis confluens]|uniref:Non-haem dioxygenase N-terminal domain-containing protein n=1 Tax=Collybiopsis confluens TaxID=2823264 RepID=A0A8H5I104_9AGAR|nr:hypothetical protein D9757_001267 [Collybiopsis confluens]